MAIYRPPKARWPLGVAAGAIGILVGLLIGLAVGSGDPDPADAARDVRAALASASGSLEVAVIEYEEAVGPEGIESRAEYDGARAAFDSSRARYDEVRPALEVIAPSVAAGIDGLYDRCGALVEDQAEASDVEECVADLAAALEAEG